MNIMVALINRKNALSKVISILEFGGFSAVNVEKDASSFDIIAKKSSFILILKFSYNIDSLSESSAHDLKKISSIFSACPLLIGEKTRMLKMQEGVLHARYGINAVTLPTFEDILTQNEYPLISSSRGGFYVRVDGEKLRKLRIKKDISRGELADNLGVTRTTVYSYEKRGISAAVSTVIKLEEYLGGDLAIPSDVFGVPLMPEITQNSKLTDEERITFNSFEKIGFNITRIMRAPFDAIAKTDTKPLLTKIDKKPEKKLSDLTDVRDFSRLASCFAVIVTDSNQIEENFNGLPVVKSSELKKISNQDELFETIKERSWA